MKYITHFAILIGALTVVNKICAQELKMMDISYSKLRNPKITILRENEKFQIREIQLPYLEKYGDTVQTLYKTVNYDMVAKDGSKQLIFEYITLKGDFPTDFYEVVYKKKSGLINASSGEIIVPCLYERINKLTDSLFMGRKNGYHIYNCAGKLLIEQPLKTVVYNSANRFIYDRAAKELVTFTTKGETIMNYKARYVTISENYFVVEKNAKQSIIDFKGKLLLPYKFEQIKLCYTPGYIVVGSNTKAGLKYGMYSDYTLAQEIFPIEYDELNEISLENFREGTSRNVFAIQNKKDVSLTILDQTKQPLLQFKNYKSEVSNITQLYDYFLIYNNDGEFDLFLNNSGPIQNTVSYSEYYIFDETKGLTDYTVFFDYSGHAAMLPNIYGTKRNYFFEGEYPSFEYISDNCYTIMDERKGNGLFLPNREQFLVYMKEKSNDNYVLETFPDDLNMLIMASESSNYLVYDLHSDSLLASVDNKTNDIKASAVIAYITNKINLYLEKHFKEDLESVNVVADESNKRIYNWIDGETGNTLFTTPFIIKPYNEISVVNGKNEPIKHNFKSWQIAFENDVDDKEYVTSALFTDTWKLIRPLSTGRISQVMILPNDTLIVTEFTTYGDIDSSQVYSCARNKTVFFKNIKKFIGKNYFYLQLNEIGITSQEGVTGLIDFDGKLIIPFIYDNFTIDEEGIVAKFYGRTTSYYFIKSKLILESTGSDDGAVIKGTNCFAMPDATDKYGIYDIVTGLQILPHVTDSPDFSSKERYIMVGTEDKYGAFDVIEQKLVLQVIYSLEEIGPLMMKENYMGIKFD